MSPNAQRLCVLIVSLATAACAAPGEGVAGKGPPKPQDPKPGTRVAALTPQEIERIASERVKALPERVPKKHREMLYVLIKRQLSQERHHQKGKIRWRGVGARGHDAPQLDICQMYLHAEETVSRGYAGQVVNLTTALTDSSEWQQDAAPTGQALSVMFQVYVKPMNAALPRPLIDGETLRDRGGQDGKGDKYCIVFRAGSPCYVYIVQLDQTGRFYPLYPSARFESEFAFGKPVQPGVLHTAPPAPQGSLPYFHLDRNRGDESLYFLASMKRRPDIEQAFRYFEQANVALPSVATRGLTRVGRPSVHRGPQGIDRPLALPQANTLAVTLPGAKLYQPTHGDLLVTRWFVHR